MSTNLGKLGVAQNIEYAGVLSRVVAIVVDTILLGIVSIIIFFLWSISLGVNMVLLGGLILLLNVAYSTYLEGTTGQTLGKKLVEIKVVKEETKKPDITAALIRTILRVIDGLFFYMFGFVIIAVSKKNQRLGDLAAGTVVVTA